MTQTVELPLWLFIVILLFATVTAASHFLFPSVRWFLRRRAERLVAELNKRLERPIQPFKLARRTDMIQRLIYDPKVAEAISDHAKETGLREDVVFEQAKRYAREIVPGFSATAYFGIAIRLARWLSTRLYDVRLGHHDAEQMKAIDADATIIYVINHRSNMDYVLVTYLVAGQSALSYAVGEWARIWPLRPLIRALGGYFIRRRYRSPLYRRVLARYVQMATTGGVMQAVFPEGGLSQDGRLASPKVGILSYIVEDFDPEARDVVFVPVALNYDRVVEDTLLIEARKKGEKRFRGTIPSALAFSLRYAWRRITGRARRFGVAAVSFGEPLSLRGSPGLRHAPRVANELMHRIARVTPVLPVPLVCAMLEKAGGTISRVDMLEAISEASAALGAGGAVLLLPGEAPEIVLDEALSHLILRKIVQDSDGLLSIFPGKEDLVTYYAGSILEVADALAARPLPLDSSSEQGKSELEET